MGDYHFVNSPKFRSEDIVDWSFATCHGKKYGISMRELKQNYKIPVTDVCISNLERLGDLNTVIVFVTTSAGVPTLRKRIQNRQKIDEERLKKRMKTAEKDLKYLDLNRSTFDYIVVNDDLQTAFDELADF